MQSHALGEPPEVRAGLILGRYELLVPIASGGMAQVWAARMKGARQFQKIVAVKTMLPKLSEDAQFEQMFLDEASLASQIKHPNAVEILDLGDQQGILYLVMEMIEGVPLHHLMKASKTSGGIPLPIGARIALQASAGLHAAHELQDDKGRLVGLVHRDVSPQNLLVTYDGVTKVVDFGVAKATALGGGMTQAGQVKGKVSYMAPEQVNGEGLDRRADVFALGIVLYALTTGKHPFRRESEAATMYNICSTDSVVPPSSVVDGYPAELEKIVLKALKKDREQRYESCDALSRDLGALPAELRVGSDSDVAHFIRDLMGEKRSAQKRRIEEAITKADANPQGGWTGVDGTEARVPMGTLSGTHDLSGVATGMHPHTARNRLLGVAGLAALAISGGVLVSTVLSRSTPEANTLAPPPVPQVVELPVAAPVPKIEKMDSETRADSKNTDNEGLDLGTLPEEEEQPALDKKTADETKPPPSAAAPAPRTLQPRPTVPKKRPAPAPKPSSESWKFDAGF